MKVIGLFADALRRLPLRRLDLALVAAFCVVAAAYALDAPRPLDNLLAEWRARILTRQPSHRLTVVEIDARSLRSAQQWPWPRSNFAAAIANLHAAGADLVGFDVDFSAQSNSADDDALRRAVDRDPGAVVLPTFLQRSGEENAPLASLSQNAVLGSVNVVVDSDGRVRRYNRGFSHGSRYFSSMAAVLAGAPYGDTGEFLIDYGINAERIDHLSFQDVLSGNFDQSLVRGRAVLIGATALELGDKFATPTMPAIPGVYVHALAFESIAQGRALFELRGAILFFLTCAVLLFLWPFKAAGLLRRVAVRHAIVLGSLLLAPLLLQAIAPVSVNIGLALIAQMTCLITAVRRELDERATQLIVEREQHLQFIAHHDPETALPNRRAMLEGIARGSETPRAALVVLAAVGVDRFSLLRGAVGYSNANKIVAMLARRLEAQPGVCGVYLVSTSIIGVVGAAADEADARHFAEQCANPRPRDFVVDGVEAELSLRVGVAIAPRENAGADKLLESASLALDRAREQKRRIVLAEENSLDPLVQFAIVSDVRRGLDRGDFTVLYQPKVASATAAVAGAESLLRWNHPVHGAIAPDIFIAAAEDAGSIGELTAWVLRRVIDDQVDMARAGVDLPLSVNLSARTLTDPVFCQEAIRLVEEKKARICFEITETAVIQDPAAAIESVAAFRRAGISISIDDYGAGLSSLSYLKQIAADEVKMDRSLVGALTSSNRDRLILKSTIDLAHSLGMAVVAEGVEQDAERLILSAMGCDLVQGFLVSKPVTLNELVAFCRAKPADARREPHKLGSVSLVDDGRG